MLVEIIVIEEKPCFGMLYLGTVRCLYLLAFVVIVEHMRLSAV
jgi:hypothetical protein